MKIGAEDVGFLLWTISATEFSELSSLSIVFCKLYRYSTQHIYLKKVMGSVFVNCDNACLIHL